jgi:hypothetical protein
MTKFVASLATIFALAIPTAASASTPGASFSTHVNTHQLERTLLRAEHKLAVAVHAGRSQAEINADGARVKVLAYDLRQAEYQQAASQPGLFL